MLQPTLTDKMAERKVIDCCIFDMDGLLLDTETIYTRVTQEIVQRYGKKYEWSLKSRMMGMRQMEAARLLIETLQIPMTPEEYLAERNRKQDELFPLSNLMPGAERLLRHLHAHRVPIALATSSHRNAFEVKTNRHKELFNLFHTIVTGDDPAVERGKPHPDIFEVAAKRLGFPIDDDRLGVHRSKCLVFEDAPAGVEAAVAARMPVCWVPDERLDRQGLDRHDGVYLLASLEHFDPTHFGLPAFTIT